MLVEGWKSIQEVLDELAADKEQKADTRNQAEGFSRRIDELETAVIATAWNDILGILNSTSISLQDHTVSLNTATSLMASLVDTVQFARDRFDMGRWRPKRFNTANERLSSVEAVSESECLMK